VTAATLQRPAVWPKEIGPPWTPFRVPPLGRAGTAAQIADLLDSPELADLTADLDALRWTGRKGYGARALVGACLVKSLYAIPTWSRTARLIGDHAGLQHALGAAPSVYACYRFATKLREQKPILDACL
jgi:hypothetical protein